MRHEIERNLRSLNQRYRNAPNTKEALYASKLAIIELGGWIETSMDDIVERCATRHLREQKNREFCKQKIIQTTWGFEYDKHFKNMLIRLIGLIRLERIEKHLDTGVHSAFLASLGAMKIARNLEAHTYLKGTTRSVLAPSVTLSHYSNIEKGLAQIDRAVRLSRY